MLVLVGFKKIDSMLLQSVPSIHLAEMSMACASGSCLGGARTAVVFCADLRGDNGATGSGADTRQILLHLHASMKQCKLDQSD